jgi:hypothetical protein
LLSGNDQDQYEELEYAEEYFPYIGHELDRGRDRLSMREKMIGGLFEEIRNEGSSVILSGPNNLYSQVRVNVSPLHKEIAAQEDAVELLCPRHKSLLDYALLQPIHHDFVNNKIIIVAGHNLFVGKFDDTLRHFGAFIYLRDSSILKKAGLKKVYLSKIRYQREVFPAYLDDQVFPAPPGSKHDLLVFIEYEKEPQTGKSNAGRTKRGFLRELNWSFIKLLYEQARKRGTALYITPQNVSFSKIPDAVYVNHPTILKGKAKTIRYLIEQHFVFDKFPKFAAHHEEAKMRAVINYGEPECITEKDLKSFRDFKLYTMNIKEKIGRLETVFPLSFIYSCMGEKTEISFPQLQESMKRAFDFCMQQNIITDSLADERGNLMETDRIVDEAVTHLNANPSFSIPGYNSDKILSRSRNSLISHDSKLQVWYANTIKHLGLFGA